MEDEGGKDLCRQLQDAVVACLDRAEPLLRGAARATPAVTVRCDLRGATAGQAIFHAPDQWSIRFNPILAQGNLPAFLGEVVTHEVAHVVAVSCNRRRVRPHGAEWRAVMTFLGIPDPQRCHSFSVPAAGRRRQRRWTYRCDCREHALSTTRHKRSHRGTEYRCVHCRGVLRPARDVR